MHYVYILRSEGEDPEFYLGCTSDLKRRVREHNSGANRSTKHHQWSLVYYEAYVSKKAAMGRERILKHDGRSRRALMDRLKFSL